MKALGKRSPVTRARRVSEDAVGSPEPVSSIDVLQGWKKAASDFLCCGDGPLERPFSAAAQLANHSGMAWLRTDSTEQW